MMNNEKPDISSLRIDRSQENNSSPRGGWRFSRILLASIGLLVVLSLAFWLVPRLFNSAIDVQLVSATLSSPAQANAVLTASGYVVAQRKAAVASKATGKLEYLGVVEGDRVRKGGVLARLEDADIRASLDQSRANVRLNEADLKDAEQWVARQKTLLERGLSTQADYDAAESRYQRVLASIAVAKAIVVGAEVALENTLIRAPFDGTVLTKNADVGEMVAPMAAGVGSRSAVVTIADMGSLQVEADVSEANIERIAPGQPCEITLDAYPETRYAGYAAKIVPTADRAKATVMVKVGFKSYDARVLPEMSAKVLFLTHDARTASSGSRPILAIPANCVVSRSGQRVVFVVRNDVAVSVPVTTGRDLGTLVEITAGLSVGDRVISDPVDHIVDGALVRAR